MAETLNNNRWLWHDIMKDLEIQGGLYGVMIDPMTVEDCACGGQTKEGIKFAVSWIKDTLFIISMEKENKKLVEACAVVLEYRPFCKYIEPNSGLITFEWAKKDAKKRFAELQKKNDKVNLKKVK